MFSESERQFWEAFAANREGLLSLLLRHIAGRFERGQSAIGSALGDFIIKVLPAFAEYRRADNCCNQIFGYESARWEYRFYDYGTEDKGVPTVTKERPYELRGIALIPVPDDEFSSSGWELYWLEDGTLLSASRTADHYLNSGNQSSTLEISAHWIDRAFKRFSDDDVSTALAVPQLCTLLQQMLEDWQKLNKNSGSP